MTGPEYTAAITSLGMTKEQAAKWLGVSRASGYVFAKTGPTAPAARAIRMAVAVRSCERWGQYGASWYEKADGEWVRHSDLIKLLEIEGG